MEINEPRSSVHKTASAGSRSAYNLSITGLQDKYVINATYAGELQAEFLREVLKKVMRKHSKDCTELTKAWHTVLGEAGNVQEETFARAILHLTTVLEPNDKPMEMLSASLSYIDQHQHSDQFIKSFSVLAAQAIVKATKTRKNGANRELEAKTDDSEQAQLMKLLADLQNRKDPVQSTQLVVREFRTRHAKPHKRACVAAL